MGVGFRVLGGNHIKSDIYPLWGHVETSLKATQNHSIPFE